MKPDSFTKEKFEEALKIRSIWLNNLRDENIRIKSFLGDAFFPYQVLMQKEYEKFYPNSLYEIETYLFIKDKNTLSVNVDDIVKSFPTKPYVELNVYLMPIRDSENSEDIPVLRLLPPEENSLNRLIRKFSQEINMNVETIYG